MFLCAPEPKTLRALFENRFVLDDLKSLGAGVALGVRDFSEEHALAVCLLNRLNIPVSAWLMPSGEESGRWDCARVAEHYDTLTRWSERKGLRWSAVGFSACTPGKTEGAGKPAGNPENAFIQLIERAHADGLAVEVFYNWPKADKQPAKYLGSPRFSARIPTNVERCVNLEPCRLKAGGELSAPRERSQAVCVSSTRAGQYPAEGAGGEAKTWPEFAQELRLARQESAALYILSLESCAKQGFLDRMVTLEWNGEIPGAEGRKAGGVRKIQGELRKRPWLVVTALMGFVGGAFLIAGKKKK